MTRKLPDYEKCEFNNDRFAVTKKASFTNSTRDTPRTFESARIVNAVRAEVRRELERVLDPVFHDLASGLVCAATRERDPARRATMDELVVLCDFCRRRARVLAGGGDDLVPDAETFRMLLVNMAKEYRDVFRFRMDVEIAGLPVIQDGDGWRELYLLLCEAVWNAYKHSQGAYVKILIDPTSLVIRDDGFGLAAPILSGSDGMGCSGIRERAGRLGGNAFLLEPPANGWRVVFLQGGKPKRAAGKSGGGTPAWIPSRGASGERIRDPAREEQSRIAHDLHDGLMQVLTGLGFRLRALALSGGADSRTLDELAAVAEKVLGKATEFHHRYAGERKKNAI